MELVSLDPGVLYTSWNDSDDKIAAGFEDGSVAVYEPENGGLARFKRVSMWKAHNAALVKLVWAPSEYGHLLACGSNDGTISLWEEIEERDKQAAWRPCVQFSGSGGPVLDVQFGNCASGLRLVAAGADGSLRVFEASNVLELSRWQLQAEFSNGTDMVEKLENITCSAASISWRPPTGTVQAPVFIAGFRTHSPEHGIAKIWGYGETHQRWHIIAELSTPEYENGQINHVSWAPNIGRPYELIAVASSTSLSIWSVKNSASPDQNPTVKLLGYFTEHQGEVWQAEWDMTGMTLASTGTDGVVRLWQSNYRGNWELKGVIEGARGE